jgi:hypothetical protein
MAPVRLNPKDRLMAMRGDDSEGGKIERRRLEELIAAEDRVAVLEKKPDRTPDEEAELVAARQFVVDARAAGGFDVAA